MELVVSLILLCIPKQEVPLIRRASAKELSITPPKGGFVPDEKTAIKISEAVLIPIYGDSIIQFRPFVASLGKDGLWTVKGVRKTFTHDEIKRGKYSIGGVPYVVLSKVKGTIVSVYHTK